MTEVLNLFNHVTQIINKKRVHSPPNTQLLQFDNC